MSIFKIVSAIFLGIIAIALIVLTIQSIYYNFILLPRHRKAHPEWYPERKKKNE